jgi:hypothetical protein
LNNGNEVWEGGIKARGKRGAEKKEGHAEEQLGQEGHEPQAGHRHRTLRSALERRQGPGEEIVFEEVGVEEVFIEEIVI